MAAQSNHEQAPLRQKEIFFRGKDVIITGGSLGIGQALAEQLAQFGAQVLVVDISQPGTHSENVTFIQADVGNRSMLETQTHCKKVDLLIIAAGITSETNDPTPQEKNRMEAVNVGGVKNTLDVFSPLLASNSQVIYIGSDDPPKAYYADTKKRGVKLVRSFSKKHPNTTTQIIYLGPVSTPLFSKGKTPETIQRIRENVGLYEPAEFAEELIDQITSSINGKSLQERTMYKKISKDDVHNSW